MSMRERTLASKTLVCFLQGLATNSNLKVKVDFRDETSVTGKIQAVDGYMNIEMIDVTYEAPSGSKQSFSKYCCQGKFIRYVHIPDEIDPLETIEDRLVVLAQPPQRGRGRGRGRGGRGGRGRGGGGGRFSRGGGGGGGGSRYGYDRRSGDRYGGGGDRYRSSGDRYGGGGGSSSDRYGSGGHRSGGYSSSSRYDRPRY